VSRRDTVSTEHHLKTLEKTKQHMQHEKADHQPACGRKIKYLSMSYEKLPLIIKPDF